MEETLFPPRLGRNAALLGDDRVGKEARPGADKAENQKRRGKRIAGVLKRKGEGNCAVNEKIHRDIEKPAKVGAAGSTRHRPVKPVEQPVEEQQHDGRDAPAKHHSTGRADPAAETGKRDLVRTDTRSGKPLPDRIKHPVDHRPQ